MVSEPTDDTPVTGSGVPGTPVGPADPVDPADPRDQAAPWDPVADPWTTGGEPAGTLAGEPDDYQRLWTPHRMVYIGGQDKPSDGGAGQCPFCLVQGRDDAEGLVVARTESAFVVLNLYPYNSGHLMVVPYRHVADCTELDDTETLEIARLTQTAVRVLRQVMAPQGFNLGMNQGAVAGAGIAAHLHQHVVPRWAGDANFLPIIGRTKAMPELLGTTRTRLADAWPTEGTAPC